MGGGCGLAAALDRVIAARDAVFAMPEVTLGVAPADRADRRPPPGCTSRPLAHVERDETRRGRRARGGPRRRRDAGRRTAVAVAAELRALAVAEPRALRATKRLVTLATSVPLGEALDGAALEFAALLRAGAAREGIAAARERRRPAWCVDVPSLPEFT